MPLSLDRASLGEELRNNLQIGLATGVIGGGLLGFLAAAATLALNPALLRSTGDVARLILGLQAVYAVLCLGLGLLGAGAKTLLYLFTRKRISDTKTAAFATGTVFFLIGAVYIFSWCRWHGVGGLAPGRPLSGDHLPVLLVTAGVALLLARLMTYAFYLLIVHFKKPERRSPGDLRKAFFILLYMAGAFAAFVAVISLASDPPRRGRLTAESVSPAGRTVHLLGIDGMATEDFSRLRAAGRLGWMKSFDVGRRGTLDLPGDPVPPMLWTAIATGRDLASHGIFDFQTQVVRGLSTPLRVGPNQVGVYNLFHTVMPFVRLTRSVPVKSYMRETKGLWNIATDAGKSAVVVNWWVSWPAERVHGAVVSDHAWLKLAGDPASVEVGAAAARRGRTFAEAAASVQPPREDGTGATSPIRPDGRPLLLERETWPSTLLLELAPLADGASHDSLESRLGSPPSEESLAHFEALGIPADVLRSDLFYARAAARLLEERDPDLWMLHLPGPDIIRRILDRRGLAPEAREAARREALDAYWEVLDPPLIAALGGDAATGLATRATADATHDPEQEPVVAMLIALPGAPWRDRPGPRSGFVAVSEGRISAEPADARDRELDAGTESQSMDPESIAPTVLWLLGLPASEEMDAAPRTDLLTGPAADALGPVRWIASYGSQPTEGLEAAAGTLDEEMLERFRSLGYIR